MNKEERGMAEAFLTREIGRRILKMLEDVSDVPVNIIVDALLSVAVALVTAANLDEDTLAEEWLMNVKRSKIREGKV